MTVSFNNKPVICERQHESKLTNNVDFHTRKMSKEAFDELSVLSAIYCERDEFEVLEESPEKGIVFCIHTLIEDNNEKTPLRCPFPHLS